MNPLDPKVEYTVPKGQSNYVKFEKGETEFLPLDSAIVGYAYWNEAAKPVRSAEEFKGVPDDIRHDKDGKPESIKHFWAFPVWDIKDRRVKVLEITQKTIMTAIRNYTVNKKWGSPVLKYSFTINREGDGFDTEYTIMANPAEAVIDHEAIEAWEAAQASGFDITRLYTGGDPFTPEEKI